MVGQVSNRFHLAREIAVLAFCSPKWGGISKEKNRWEIHRKKPGKEKLPNQEGKLNFFLSRNVKAQARSPAGPSREEEKLIRSDFGEEGNRDFG
jgi:hypothetical protein